MKRAYIVILVTLLFSMGSFAQKGNNAIGVGGDMGFPVGDFGDNFKAGFGIYAKAMLGVGNAGQVTFTSGYSGFKEKGSFVDYTSTVNIIPLFVGYRHYFNSVFVEPQLGYAVYGSKYLTPDDGSYTESDGAFNAAATIGYVFDKGIELSARYQTGGKQGWNVNLFGLRLGYNFSLKKAK
jgi:Outer membrane protein beta-barrel domain